MLSYLNLHSFSFFSPLEIAFFSLFLWALALRLYGLTVGLWSWISWATIMGFSGNVYKLRKNNIYALRSSGFFFLERVSRDPTTPILVRLWSHTCSKRSTGGGEKKVRKRKLMRSGKTVERDGCVSDEVFNFYERYFTCKKKYIEFWYRLIGIRNTIRLRRE